MIIIKYKIYDMSHRIGLSDADVVDILLKGNIDKFCYIISTNKLTLQFFDVLFDKFRSTYVQYGIRMLFVSDYRNIIMKHLYDKFKSSHGMINYLLINYRGRNELEIYKTIHEINNWNYKILDIIRDLTYEIPFSSIIQDMIFMSDINQIKLLFMTNEAFQIPVIKHLIYTKNHIVNYVICNMVSYLDMLLKIISALHETYDEQKTIEYNQNINYLRGPEQLLPYTNAEYLYECMMQLLNYETVTQLFQWKVHLCDIKFFEVCCNHIMKNFDFRGKRISIDQHRARLIFGDNYKCLIKVLSKKCLTKRMLKFGAYDQSDNLNERHLVDLIMTFIK